MAAKTVRPLGENILIQPEKPEAQTDAGIFLPESAKDERSQIGTVIGVGDSDKITVKAGQSVLFKRYGGEEVTVDGEEYLIASYKDILAVIE